MVRTKKRRGGCGRILFVAINPASAGYVAAVFCKH